MTHPFTIPAHLREVPAAEFFATVGRMDVHPRAERDMSVWETRQRQEVGRSWPGYMCADPNGRHYSGPKVYAVRRA